MAAQFVDYGPRATFPPPFTAEGGRFLGVVLKSTKKALQGFIDKVLNVPAAQNSTDPKKDPPPVRYKLLWGRPDVVMLVGSFKRQFTTARGYTNLGFASETGMMFWVPLQAEPLNDNTHFCLLAPYVFVDNPMSLMCGREDLGYAKAMARFAPADGLGPTVTVNAFGGNFGLGFRADYDKVVEVVEVGPVPPEAPRGQHAGLFAGMGLATPQTPEEVAKELMARAHYEEPTTEGPGVLGLVDMLTRAGIPQVFLKQFRDASKPNQACYQTLIEAHMDFPKAQAEPGGLWDVKILPLDSFPIAAELGVKSERTELTFQLETDMTVSVGNVVAP